MRRIFSAFVLIALMVSPAAYAQGNSQKDIPVVEVSPIYDPIEPFNRAVFQFNRGVDFLILRPVTWVYKNGLPSFVHTSVSSFLDNLGAPIVMLNSALQGDWTTFEASLHRFVVNTTLGLGGLNDVASDLGIAPVSADFGQTLGKWGVGHGMYLVLPVIGSSSIRDGSGKVVDSFADPYNIVFMDSETEWPIYARMGVTAIDRRYQAWDLYEDVMNNAVDPYVTFRSIYVQRRAYLVQGRGADAYGEAEAN